MQPAKHVARCSASTSLSLSPKEHCSCCRDALASAAHELKTPLAIMGGYLHLLLTEKLGPLNPRQMEVLTEMQANGVRLSNFIQNLLTYTSLKVDRFEMQYEVGDINDCIREIAEVWAQRFHDKAIAFYFLPSEKLQPFPFDYYKVQHVVSNLLDNAMKYTPSSGTVWLHVEPYFWERRTDAAAAAGGAPQSSASSAPTAAASRSPTPVRESRRSSSRKFSKSTSA